MNNYPCLYIIGGTTGVGKSQFAIKWGRKYNAEIINADSLLFYKQLNIGVAKPSLLEQMIIPHHLINISSVLSRYNIKNFIFEVKKAISYIQKKNKIIFIVGGTGFYLRSLFYPVFDYISNISFLKKKIIHFYKIVGLHKIIFEIKMCNNDFNFINYIDKNNPIRMQNILIQHLIKNTINYKHYKLNTSLFVKYPKQLIILNRNIIDLYKRIYSRIELMLEIGFIQEVSRLIYFYLNKNSIIYKAIGYKETINFLKNKNSYSINNLRNSIFFKTISLIKKQKTWIKQKLPYNYMVNLSPLF